MPTPWSPTAFGSQVKSMEEWLGAKSWKESLLLGVWRIRVSNGRGRGNDVGDDSRKALSESCVDRFLPIVGACTGSVTAVKA